MTPAEIKLERAFFGWRVVAGAFVLAIIGWGLGFYGVSIYLHAVQSAQGWSIGLVSAAVTLHFLSGALVVANLPALYRRFGLSAVTRVGVLAVTTGLVGWASVTSPWQMFLAALLTGCGWVTMGAAAINAIVSPWFVRDRPKALSTAYNGASVGGILFTPLLVFALERFGFQSAAILIGVLIVIIVWMLTFLVFRFSPKDLGQWPDGVEPVQAALVAEPASLAGSQLWQDRRFLTLAAGMALGLFAQIGLLSHLFSVIVPVMGQRWAGVVMGLATAAAILGRTSFGWMMPAGADRRYAAMASYAIQIVGALLLIVAGAQSTILIILGILLFGFGIGNATSLPPLIAQVEFGRQDTSRVVALIVAIGQATYAFAPASFGLIRELSSNGPSWPLFAAAIVVKMLAISAFALGRGARKG